MAETTYTYPLTDFPNDKADAFALSEEVRESTITIAVDRVDVGPPDRPLDVDVVFKDALTTEQQDVLDGLVAAHQGNPIQPVAPPQTSTGAPLVVLEPRADGSTFNALTPNWCDKTTWYFTSVKVTDETLTDSGNLTTFTSAHTFWIDLHHGKVTQEQRINGTNYGITLKVNGVTKTENSLDAQNGDYSVNYVAGTVTFNAALQGGDVVTATYNYATDSIWKVLPASGKKVSIRAVEVQFSLDIELTDTAIFEMRGLVEVFAPQLLDTNGGPYPAGTKIPIQSNKYPRMHNYIDEAQQAYPDIPALGGAGWRGMQQAMHLFRWPYTDSFGQYVEVKSSLGMELWIYLENHSPFGGERAVATLYARSDDE
jgi:hypothetical protein